MTGALPTSPISGPIEVAGQKTAAASQLIEFEWSIFMNAVFIYKTFVFPLENPQDNSEHAVFHCTYVV